MPLREGRPGVSCIVGFSGKSEGPRGTGHSAFSRSGSYDYYHLWISNL